MTEREKFERKFPLPERCEWSDALSQYCWVYTSAAHPHENFWDVWQEAIAQSPQVPEGMALVPVDALNSIMELAGVALVYQPFGTKDRQHFNALLAATKDQQCQS